MPAGNIRVREPDGPSGGMVPRRVDLYPGRRAAREWPTSMIDALVLGAALKGRKEVVASPWKTRRILVRKRNWRPSGVGACR